MANQKQRKTLSFLVVSFLIFGLAVSFLFPAEARAANMTTAADYLNRMIQSQESGITHEILFTPATEVSTDADNKVILLFPDEDDGLWCRMAGNDLTVTTTDLRSSANALPGASATATCEIGSGPSSYDTITITFPNEMLFAGTLYGVRVAGGLGAQLGTPSNLTTGVITIKTNETTLGDIDTALVAVDILVNDQITVTGRVEPTITFSISDNTVGFGVILSSAIRYATDDEQGSSSEPIDTEPSRLVVSTNADDGAIIELKSTNGDTTAGLYSVSSGTTLLNLASSAVAAGTEGFGVYGKNATSLTINEGFNDDSTDDLAVTTDFLPFAAIATPVSDGGVDVSMKAAISGITPAGSDYSTTLTFLATGRF